jgi:hypothetical protein
MKDRDMNEIEHSELSATTTALPETGLFIELGPCRHEDLARLKEGTGSRTRRIKAAIWRWREELGIDPAANVVPVVLVYRRVRSPNPEGY